MEKTITKNFIPWHFEEEEAWLNELSQSGWQLIDVLYNHYTFEKKIQEKYYYQIELSSRHLSPLEKKQRLEELQAEGASLISQQETLIYLRRPTSLGRFAVLTDQQTKLNYFNELITRFALGLAIVLFSLFITVFLQGFIPSTGEHLFLGALLLEGFLASIFGIAMLNVSHKKQALEKESLFRQG